MDNVPLSWLQVPVWEEGRVGRGELGSQGGPAGWALACSPTHRKVYLATLLFSSTVRSARSPGWRMETRTLLTVECLSRWRAHCTVMALAVTFVISKPSTGRGPGRSKQRGLRSAAGHPVPFPHPCGCPAFPSGLASPAGTHTRGQAGGTTTCLPTGPCATHDASPAPAPTTAPNGTQYLRLALSLQHTRGGHPEPSSRCPQLKASRDTGARGADPAVRSTMPAFSLGLHSISA